jgi:hypothetical protein
MRAVHTHRRFAAGCALLLALACRRRVNEYPPEIVENFLRACQSRGSEAACRCALTKVQERYTADEFRALEAQIVATRKPTNELLDIIDACR